MIQNNLAPFGTRSIAHNRAVWRSDQDVKLLSFHSSLDSANTGGGVVAEGNTIRSVAVTKFDDLMDEVTHHGKQRVRLLKLDCEGSEWGILLTSHRLHLIDAICGEYHDISGWGPQFDVGPINQFTTHLLVDTLTAHGFEVELDHTKLPCGLFFARRPNVAHYEPTSEPGMHCYPPRSKVA